ncbi:trypsin-7 [Leptinotarsa decemlineata]|uniref:trypsin-7 n=1 Tax=Leptinotarsa decemlineata TaxID=7539 RepID=UPI003D304801
MRKSILLPIIILGTVTIEAFIPQLDGRIVGGKDANITSFPYQVSLLRGLSHVCGGSIFHTNYILTAAHCVHGYLTTLFSIRVGSSIANQGDGTFKVCKIHIHDKFDQNTMDNDIAILTLCSPLKFSATVLPIALPGSSEAIPTGAKATVTGWEFQLYNFVIIYFDLVITITNKFGYIYNNLLMITYLIMSFSQTYVFLLLFGVVYSANIRPTLKIVGGSNASIEDYPYQISLQFYGRHGCGGSILNPLFILTAAHCIFDVNSEQISVRVGSSYRNSDGEVYAVSKIYKHPLFDLSTFDFDIALLKLRTELTFGPGVQPVAIASSGTIIPNGVSAIATGWGRLLDGGPAANQLQVVTLPTITTESCKTYYDDASITDRMMCAGYDEGGKDTCEGDSGGPLVVTGIQIGITSWGDVCAKAGKPGIFTKLTEFKDYIDSIINS